MIKKHLPWLVAVFLLTGALYSNCLRNDFNLDDDAIIRDNPLIRSLSNLPRIFASNYWAATPYAQGVLLYRPLAVATFTADYALWGSNPAGFHLVNLLLNAADAALVYVLLALLFGDRLGPGVLCLCALLFASHPVHTEAVNLVVGRTELLAAMFGLLTFISHIRGWTTAATLAFLLALLSKEIAVTIPVTIFLYEWLFGRKIQPRRYLLYGGVLAFYLVIRFAVLRGFVAGQQTGILYHQDLYHRLLTVTQVIGCYLRLLVLPYPLTPDYSDVVLATSWSHHAVLAPAAAIAGLLAWAWKARRTAAAISFAILWFFVTVLPVSNLISIGAFAGERLLYLPSVSVALLLAGVAGQAARPSWMRACLGCAGLVAATFGLLTFERNLAWKDAGTLWGRVHVHQPDNPRANYHLAVRAEQQNDYPKAIELYQRATRHYPDHNWNPDRKTIDVVKQKVASLAYEMAVRLYRAEKFAEAMTYCQEAVKNDAGNAEAYVVLGNLYVRTDDLGAAAGCYETALKLNPAQFEARENLRRIRSLY